MSNPYLVARAGNYVRAGSGGSPPTGLRSFEPCAPTFNPSLGAGLQRPVGSILFDQAGDAGWVKYGSGATQWFPISNLGALMIEYGLGGRLWVPVDSYTIPAGPGALSVDLDVVGANYQGLLLVVDFTFAVTPKNCQVLMEPDGGGANCSTFDSVNQLLVSAAAARILGIVAVSERRILRVAMELNAAGDRFAYTTGIREHGFMAIPAATLRVRQSDASAEPFAPGSNFTLWGRAAP